MGYDRQLVLATDASEFNLEERNCKKNITNALLTFDVKFSIIV